MSKIAKTARTKVAEGSKAALKGAGDAFNRLDELGGEARDTFKEWFDQSPAMGTVREMIRKRRESNGDATAATPEPGPKVEEAELVVESLGDSAFAVQVFGKRSCPWSGRAVRLLEDSEVEHQFVELDDPENANYSARLVSETKQNSVPYIYVRGEFIGGFNALDELARLGQLEARIAPKDDASGRVVVEVAPRPKTDEVAPADVADHPGDAE